MKRATARAVPPVTGDLSQLFAAAVARLEARLTALEAWRATLDDDATGGRLCLRVSEFAERVGISRAQAYNLIKAGEVPSLTLGGVKLVPVRAVRRWLEER
jgi:excisionase family DNA binding protein